MANATPVRTGQINGAGDVDALFLKVFAGEVLTAFEVNNVALAYTQMKTISNGKSASFPTFGRIAAEYHTPGNEITGLTVNGNEVVITIDDLLISHTFITNIDEAKAHYDARSVYSTEMGRALATQMDKHILQMAVKTARAAAFVTGLPGGSSIYNGPLGGPATKDFLTVGLDIAYAMFKAAEILDTNNVPADGRVFFVKPAQYYALIQAKDTINSLWGGAGAYSDGKIFRIAGIDIVKTTNLPTTNVANGTLGAGTGNRYAGDFTKTAGLVVHKSAVATVKLLDLGMEAAYDIRRQGTLMVAKYAVGHGGLRPEAAVEVVQGLSPV
jgi:hypothetical protein